MEKWIYNTTTGEIRALGRKFPAESYVKIEREHWPHFFSCDTIRDAIDDGDIKASLDGSTTIDDKDLGIAHLYAVHSDYFFWFCNTYTPASASAKGMQGMVCYDASYIYVCTATDTWKRVAVGTW